MKAESAENAKREASDALDPPKKPRSAAIRIQKAREMDRDIPTAG
jgi:hypothetical protein